MTHMISHNQLVEICSYLPYVNLLPAHKRTFCDGWIYGGKCLRHAEWEFKKSSSKGPGRAKSGRYCDYHLLKSAIHYSKFETARANRAFERGVKKATKETENV